MTRILITLLLTASITLAGCSDDEEKAQPKTPKIEADEAKSEVVITTNKGVIRAEIYPERSPKTVETFISYVESGFYEGVIFHRVIPGFMIQTGGFDEKLTKKTPGPQIKNEATNGLSNLRGTLAMARTNVVDSATSQFFINLVDNKRLDHRGNEPRKYGYTVFGKVIEGMEVVDSIGGMKTLCPSRDRAPCKEAGVPPGMGDVPKDPIIIEKVELD